MSIHNESSPFKDLVQRHQQFIEQATQPTSSSSMPPLTKRASGSIVHFSELETTKVSGMPPLVISRPPVCSSSEQHHAAPRGSRISPRHIFSILSPRTSHGSLKHSPRNKLSISRGESSKCLQQCNLIEGVQAEAFDRNLRNDLRESIKKIALENINKSAKNRIFYIVDSHLSLEYANAESGEASSNSPRSDETLKIIHQEIKSSRGLTHDLIGRLEKVKTKLLESLSNHTTKTAWSLELHSTLEDLIKIGGEGDLFTNKYNGITDTKIRRLIQLVMGKRDERQQFIRKIKKWNGDAVPKNLRAKYALVNLNYIDLLKIPQQKLIFSGDSYALMDQNFAVKFCETLASLREVIINGKNYPLLPYRSKQMDERRFLYYFLTALYQAGGKAVQESSVTEDVDAILIGSGKAASKMILCCCILPWSKFAKKIEQITRPLQPNIKAIPNEEEASLSIEATSEGYRITKMISYNFFNTSQDSLIGTVNFYWTLSVDPVIHSNWDWLRWQGCIQVLDIPRVEKTIPFDVKWSFLKQMINFSTLSTPASLQYIPLTEDAHQVQKYTEEMIRHLNTPETTMGSDHVSWYTIEMGVKNYLWKALYELKEDCELPEFAESVWSAILSEGSILQPMINRLQIFREKLLQYALDQPIRISALDAIFTYIDLIISNKNLGFFVDVVTGGMKNKACHQLILNNMFGGYKIAKDLRISAEPQKQHIHAIIERLTMIVKGSECLYEALQEMHNSMHTHDKITITSTPHQWSFSPNKVAATRMTPFEDVVRSIMQGTEILYDRVVINHIDLHDLPMRSKKFTPQEKYIKSLLEAIYAQFDPSMTQERIVDQIKYFFPPQGKFLPVTTAEIPCLPVLQLCAINQAQNSTLFYKALFDIHHTPFSTKDIQSKECFITINSAQDYSVELRYKNGVYARELPEEIDYITTNQSRLLATVPISWKVSSYMEEDNEKLLGTFHITDAFTCHPIATPEEVHLIYKRFFNYNKEFRNQSDWEVNNIPSQSISSPLALNLAIPTRANATPSSSSQHHHTPTSPILSRFTKSKK